MMVPFSRNDNPGGFTDEQLRAAAKAVRSAMLESLKTEAEEQHSFSESFLRRLQALLRINDRRERRKHALQRVAIILIGLFLAGTLFLAFNPDARAELANWIRSTYENSVLYEFFSKKSEDMEPLPQMLPEIEFSWLPDEYEKAEVYRDDRKVIVVLSNEKDIISVEYWFASSSEYYEMFTSDHVQETVEVKGEQADYYRAVNQKASVLVWSDKNIVYNMNSFLPKEVLVKIAEGITKK